MCTFNSRQILWVQESYSVHVSVFRFFFFCTHTQMTPIGTLTICLPVVSLGHSPFAPCPLTLSKDCYYTRVLPSHVFISSRPLLCALPFHHFSHLLSRSPSLYRSLSVSLGSGIHRHSEDGTRTQDTSQYHRHVRLWDPCCSRWGPRSCCLHQHQGWPGQMVGTKMNER